MIAEIFPCSGMIIVIRVKKCVISTFHRCMFYFQGSSPYKPLAQNIVPLATDDRWLVVRVPARSNLLCIVRKVANSLSSLQF